MVFVNFFLGGGANLGMSSAPRSTGYVCSKKVRLLTRLRIAKQASVVVKITAASRWNKQESRDIQVEPRDTCRIFQRQCAISLT